MSEAIERSPMIGEIGLDHYFVEDATTYPDRRKVFENFLGAVREQAKIINLHTNAQEIPSGQLLTETDNPGGPNEFIGKTRMPVLVKDIIQRIAKTRKTTVEAIVQTVQANLTELVRVFL